MSYTPGPWCLGSSDRKVSDLAICIEQKSSIPTLARLTTRNGDEYHNAKLMAAAPDLLEALMQAKRHLPVDSDVWNAADAAITKATE